MYPIENAKEIHVEGFVPNLWRFGCRRRHADTGVVHQNGDVTKREDLISQGGHCCGVGHIDDFGVDGGAGLAQVLRGGIQSIGVRIYQE